MVLSKTGAGGGTLLPVPNLAYVPKYHLQGRPGAVARLYLHAQTRDRLNRVEASLRRRSTESAQYALLVFDGYRPAAVQHDLFAEYLRRLQATSGVTHDQAAAWARTFVSQPDGVYPHGTGGAVDLTLTINGAEAWMGTGFDDFEEKSRRDWYVNHPPTTATDRAALSHRTLLFEEMRAAGFVGLESEWWHFEYGTDRWAQAARQPAFLTEVLALGR